MSRINFFLRTIFKLLFISLLIIPDCSSAQSRKKDEWRVRKNEKGIVVYSRHVEGTDVDELRIVSMMHGSLSSIAAVIMDANHYSEWIYACNESRILKQVSATEQYQYQIVDFPSPFTDRDVVIHFSIRQDAQTKIVYTKSEAAPQFISSVDKLVRIPQFIASYQLIPKGNGNVQILYSMRSNPGGYIPDWLVNLTIVTGPYQTTVNMQKQVAKKEYSQLKLPFIQEP
ncbi:MAG: START domain-containing protein [Chitinophagales bacterium]